MSRLRAKLPAGFWVPGLFLLENILGGPFGVYAGIPARFVLFGATGLVLAAHALAHGVIRRSVAAAAASVGLFLLWQALWATLVPAAAGTELRYAVAEFRPIVLLAFPVLCMLACRSDDVLRAAVRAMQRVVVAAAAVLAVFQMAIWVTGTLLPHLQVFVPLVLSRLYPGTEASLYIGPMPDGFFRVFWIGSLWLPVALFWTPAVITTRALLSAVRLVLLGGILVSYSRGIWLGLAAGLVVAFLAAIKPGQWGRELLRRAVPLALATTALLAAVAATGQLERVTARLTSTAPTQVRADDERINQVGPLVRLWQRSPLVGVGYGGYARDYVRVPEAPFSYENTSYAFLAKLGAVGLLGSLAGLAYWAASAWRLRHVAPREVPAFLGAYVTVLLSTMTNPMLLNLIGMAVLSSLLLTWAAMRSVAAAAGAHPSGGAYAASIGTDRPPGAPVPA